MWDTARGHCQAVLRGHDASMRWAELISGGCELLTASADGMVKRWDLQSVTCKQTSPGEWLAGVPTLRLCLPAGVGPDAAYLPVNHPPLTS